MDYFLVFFVICFTSTTGKNAVAGSQLEESGVPFTQMNKIFRQIFPLLPERNRIHHFNPWHEQSSSPFHRSSSFQSGHVPASLPLLQRQHYVNSPSGAKNRFIHDPLPLEIVQEMAAMDQAGIRRGGVERQGLNIPNSDPGDEDNVDGFIEELQVASKERALDGFERPLSSQFDVMEKEPQEEGVHLRRNEDGDRPRSMTSGHGPLGRRPEPAALGKRGPECMRRCIAQGVLHPVQCHSLC